MVYDWVSYLGWCKLNPKWLVNGMVYTDLLGQKTHCMYGIICQGPGMYS